MPMACLLLTMLVPARMVPVGRRLVCELAALDAWPRPTFQMSSPTGLTLALGAMKTVPAGSCWLASSWMSATSLPGRLMLVPK